MSTTYPKPTCCDQARWGPQFIVWTGTDEKIGWFNFVDCRDIHRRHENEDGSPLKPALIKAEFCPFCGAKMPLVLKTNPELEVQKPGPSELYCETCGERGQACECLPMEAQWAVIEDSETNAAWNLAKEFHSKQTYGDLPYTEHLRDTANVLYRFFDEPEPYMVQAALLHDLIEDTDAQVEDIEANVGPDIRDIVFAVTDGEGKNRKERKKAPYKKMAKNADSITIKLADRIANVESCIKRNNGLLSMYKKEMPLFEQNLRDHGGKEEMWEHLTTLLE